MSHQLRPGTRRAGPLFGVLLVVVGAVAALTPAVPGVRALDPTPAPDPTATPAPDPTATPAPDPTATPAPDPTATSTTPDPGTTPDPSVAPELTPSPEPSSSPDATPDPGASVSPDPSVPPEEPSPSPEPTATPEPIGLRTTHAWISTLGGSGKVVNTGNLDTAVTGMDQFVSYEVRFQVVNGTDLGVEIGPSLEIGRGEDASTFDAVPAPDFVPREPFFGSADLEPGGRPQTHPIPVSALRLGSSMDPAASPVDGLVSAGRNPAGTLALPAHAFTEVSFVVQASVDAPWGSTFTFRLTDRGTPLATMITAVGSMGFDPGIDLSAGQRSGDRAGEPLPLFPLAVPVGPPYSSPHFELTLTGDSCAACHAAHTAQGAYLSSATAPTARVCFQCHDGTGALVDVASQYADPAVPENNPNTGTWFSHPATEASSHTIDREDEFSGQLNRHADCADCHQPHLADATLGSQTTSGWTASGGIRGASGVAVTNGAAGSAPAYNWLQTTALEYQLCFKCHSGFTQLPGGRLDKGIELNPANGSYHPVEAAGTNQTPKMAISLAGTSPYKLWNFSSDGTVRCTHCHGNPRTREPGTPAVDERQAPHTSEYEGILLANYRRSLKPVGQAYDAADFALCYLCHGEAGIVGDRDATNFRLHERHVVDMEEEGLAVCSECHYRTHSTALRPSAQAGDTSRLVVFGPSVAPADGELSWTTTGVGRGSCTLTCHGKEHSPRNY